MAGLVAIGRDHVDSIRTEFARVPRQVSGYALEHLVAKADGAMATRAPARVLAGSEGTLGLTTAIELDLVAVPVHTVLVVLGYPDLPAAADAVPALLAHRPVAIEGLDARIVDAVRGRRADVDIPPLPDGGGWLFVELGGDDPTQLVAAAAAVVADAAATGAVVVTDAGEARALWAIREAGAGLAAVAPSGRPGHAGWEDSAVAPERLGGYLRDLEGLMSDTRPHRDALRPLR